MIVRASDRVYVQLLHLYAVLSLQQAGQQSGPVREAEGGGLVGAGKAVGWQLLHTHKVSQQISNNIREHNSTWYPLHFLLWSEYAPSLQIHMLKS